MGNWLCFGRKGWCWTVVAAVLNGCLFLSNPGLRRVCWGCCSLEEGGFDGFGECFGSLCLRHCYYRLLSEGKECSCALFSAALAFGAVAGLCLFRRCSGRDAGLDGGPL